MVKASLLPYKNLQEEKRYFKDTLAEIIEFQHDLAREKGWDPGSKKTQEDIYNMFVETVTTKRIDQFCQNFDNFLYEREIKLRQNVTDAIKEIKNWERFNGKRLEKYNKDLEEKHYLKIIARYKDTLATRELIVPVGKYLSEKEIEEKIKNDDLYTEAKMFYDKEILEIKNSNLSKKEKAEKITRKRKTEPKKYVPSFKDIDPEADLSKLEILAASNVTTLYEKNKVQHLAEEDMTLENLTKAKAVEYVIYSRVKRSFREVEKFVDKLMVIEGIPLRAEKDLPYDTIGTIIQVPNGEEMYKFMNYIIEISSTHPEIDKKYMNTLEENEENKKNGKAIKLRKDNYIQIGKKSYIALDTENLREVTQQMHETEKLVNKKIRAAQAHSKSYKISDDERERMKQGIKLGYTKENFTIETQIMIPEMLEMYFHGPIGHKADYFSSRDLKREGYLFNPALCPARIDMAEARSVKKNCQKTRDDHNKEIDILPRVDILAHLLDKLFLKAYQPTIPELY